MTDNSQKYYAVTGSHEPQRSQYWSVRICQHGFEEEVSGSTGVDGVQNRTSKLCPKCEAERAN